MFLNYWLDEELRPYAGVDVSDLDERVVRPDGTLDFTEGKVKGRLWEHWECTLMGFQSYPYLCTQVFGWSKDFIWGDRMSRDNPLGWSQVLFNLPGSMDYSPIKPWAFRVKHDGSLASFFGTICTGDTSKKGCRSVTNQVVS